VIDMIDEYLGMSHNIYYVNYSFTRHIKPIRLIWYRHTWWWLMMTLTPNDSETWW